MGAHDSGLSIAGSRESGQDVRSANVTAVATLSNILKTSLGPQGLDKMIVDDVGDVVITNDGATILKKLEIQHPAAKVLVELADLQDREVGDGTTSVVLFAAELLKRGNELVKQQIHPTSVISGFRLAMRESVKFIKENMGIKLEQLNSNELLTQVAKTTLSSKFVGGDSEFFSKLIVDAVNSVKIKNVEGKWKYPINQISVLKSHGKSSRETMLVENGYALQLARVAQGCPTRVENAKLALLDFDLKKYCMRQAEILVSDPAELEKIRQKEMDITKERINKILDTGANVIMTTRGMDDMSIKYLVDAGAMGIRRVDKADMKRLARVTGAKIQLTLSSLDGGEEFDKESLGECALVEEQRVGDNDFIFITGAKDSRASTLLLRGANDYMLEETDRSIHDALMAVGKTAESATVVPGGGAVETQLSLHLDDYARTLDSREQLAVAQFADALMVIPTTLTCNAALDAIDLTSKLRVAHHASRSDKAKADQKFFGLDLIGNKIHHSINNGVVEPMVSKLKSLKFATEAAITILRIDDLIKLEKEGEGQ
ncbi:unnamed protein product [Amoebophrya sp. A120]|nr:unnamed protein product [Amoebophrya sp. A120]|eukprot:GSA120T00014206001.1